MPNVFSKLAPPLLVGRGYGLPRGSPLLKIGSVVQQTRRKSHHTRSFGAATASHHGTDDDPSTYTRRYDRFLKHRVGVKAERDMLSRMDESCLLKFPDSFIPRHIGPNDKELKEMCEFCGVSSLDELMEQTIPPHLRREIKNLGTPDSHSETVVLDILKTIVSRNVVGKNFIGQGYHGSIVPAAIARNLYENPAWYYFLL